MEGAKKSNIDSSGHSVIQKRRINHSVLLFTYTFLVETFPTNYEMKFNQKWMTLYPDARKIDGQRPR